MLQIISRVSSSPAFDMERGKYIRDSSHLANREFRNLLACAANTVFWKWQNCWLLATKWDHISCLSVVIGKTAGKLAGEHISAALADQNQKQRDKNHRERIHKPQNSEEQIAFARFEWLLELSLLFVFSPSIQLIASWFDLISTCLVRSIVGLQNKSERFLCAKRFWWFFAVVVSLIIKSQSLPAERKRKTRSAWTEKNSPPIRFRAYFSNTIRYAASSVVHFVSFSKVELWKREREEMHELQRAALVVKWAHWWK